MLAPSTNDGRVTRSANSKAHKWNVQVTANRDELKVITTKYYEHFYSIEPCYNRTTRGEHYE
jgi:hypothetical protein